MALVVLVYLLLSLWIVSFLVNEVDLYLALMGVLSISVVSLVFAYYMRGWVLEEIKGKIYHWLHSVFAFVLVYLFPVLIVLSSWFVVIREYNQPFFELLKHDAVIGWVSAIATLLAVVVALFQDLISRALIKPKLSCILENRHPYRVRIPQYRTERNCFGTSRKNNGHAVYFRIGIHNIGNGVARNVEVFLKEIRYLCEGSDEVLRSHKLSMNLGWSNIGSDVKSYIYPHSERYCDIGVLVEPEFRESDTRFPQGKECQGRIKDDELAFMISASHKLGDCEHILGPGRYELVIDLEAENFAKEEHTFKITIGKSWNTEKDEASLNRMIFCESIIA